MRIILIKIKESGEYLEKDVDVNIYILLKHLHYRGIIGRCRGSSVWKLYIEVHLNTTAAALVPLSVLKVYVPIKPSVTP